MTFTARIAMFFLMAFAIFALPGQETVKQTFQDNGKALINPMMGWCAYSTLYAPAELTDTLDGFDGCSTVYLRLIWSVLQPTPDRIDWSLVDTAAQRFIDSGKKVALRFVTSMATVNATPLWVYEAGAKPFVYQWKDNGGTYSDPIFDDPVYLEKLEAFLAAAGKRYGNNPDVAFIDIGTFGLWGEGHTLYTQRLHQPETDRLALLHAKLHRKYFPNTLLAISDDVIGPGTPGDDFPLMKQLREMGVTFRDDSILVHSNPPWYHEELAQRYWRTMPVILEHNHLSNCIREKTWNPARLLEAVERHHASYLSINGYPDIEKEVLGGHLSKINLRLGYRLQLHDIEYPASITLKKPFRVTFSLANAGVAPCYPGGYPALTVKDAKGGLVAVLGSDAFNVRELEVGSAGAPPVKKISCDFAVNANSMAGIDFPPGTYELYFSIGNAMGKPGFALPLENDDGFRRYRVGTVKIDFSNPLRYTGNANKIWGKSRALGSKAFLTRTFHLKDKPVSAELLACTDRGELYLNGRKFAKRLDQAWVLKRYDIAAHLSSGENLIAIAAEAPSQATAILDLRIRYADGGEENIVSDAAWRVSGTAAPNWEVQPSVSAAWSPANVFEISRIMGVMQSHEVHTELAE